MNCGTFKTFKTYTAIIRSNYIHGGNGPRLIEYCRPFFCQSIFIDSVFRELPIQNSWFMMNCHDINLVKEPEGVLYLK